MGRAHLDSAGMTVRILPGECLYYLILTIVSSENHGNSCWKCRAIQVSLCPFQESISVIEPYPPSVCVIFALGTYVANSNIQFVIVAIVSDVTPRINDDVSTFSPLEWPHNCKLFRVRGYSIRLNPIQGIIFCMIVARAHRSITNSSQHVSTGGRSRMPAGSHPLRPMAVKITTQVEADLDKGADFGTPPASPRVYPMNLHSSRDTHTREDV